MRSKKEHWEKAILILGLIPLGFIISLFTFYFHAGYVLGHLPSYNLPDPKNFTFYEPYATIIWGTIATWLITILAWFGITIWYVIANRKNISWKPLLLSVFIQLSAFILFDSGITEWFAD